jgi:D-proline reductase (dithiol) PrdB
MAQASAPKPPRVLVSPSQPSWVPARKRVDESRVALLTSAALRLKHQEPFAPGEDLSYRLIPSDSKASEIVIDHHSRIGPIPRQDPEIVFPISALAHLAAKDIVGSLSPFHVSFKGGVRQHQRLENELAPAIVRELKQAGVDLALLVPYWPFCHETVGLIAHVIEGHSIPTLVVGTVLDIMTKVPSPRAVFVDHPVGRTFGRPGDHRKQEEILTVALAELPNFTEPGQIRELLCQWEASGNRAWEEELRTLLLSDRWQPL